MHYRNKQTKAINQMQSAACFYIDPSAKYSFIFFKGCLKKEEVAETVCKVQSQNIYYFVLYKKCVPPTLEYRV